MTKVETIYLGHNNTINLILEIQTPGQPNVAADLSDVDKITIEIGETCIESDDHEKGVITWGCEGYETGEIRMALGAEAITPGRYHATLTVYDDDNTDGIVWGIIRLNVVEEGS